MSLRHIAFFINLIYFFFIFTTEATIPTATLVKVRRTQSMRPLTSRKTVNDLQSTDRSGFHSSSASDVSITELKHDDPQPFPSTSTGKRAGVISPPEIEHKPLVDKATHVNFAEHPNVHETSASTHRNGEIDPTRDGVHARIRNAFTRFGTVAVVVTAIGVGGLAVQNFSEPLTNFTKVAALYSDDGIKPL